MKKQYCYCILILVMIASLCACSVSFPGKTPTEGVWYCEELRIEIDFSVHYEQNIPNCAKLYHEDGSYTNILCHFDYGRGIFLMSEDQQIRYFSGSFRYRDDRFLVTSYSDEKVYTFLRIDS